MMKYQNDDSLKRNTCIFWLINYWYSKWRFQINHSHWQNKDFGTPLRFSVSLLRRKFEICLIYKQPHIYTHTNIRWNECWYDHKFGSVAFRKGRRSGNTTIHVQCEYCVPVEIRRRILIYQIVTGVFYCSLFQALLVLRRMERKCFLGLILLQR